MLIAGQLLLSDPIPAAPGVMGACFLAPGWVRIDTAAGTIADLGRGKAPATPDIGGVAGGGDATGPLISPGFVDTHLHLPQFDSIGADGLELLPWLHTVVFPAEARWADADFAGQMAGRVAKKLLSHGTTGIAAYATVHHAATQNALRAVAEAGLRGVVGQVLMDQEAPADLIRPAGQLIREAASVKFVGRVQHAVTPRFAVSCSDELLAKAGKLAQSNGAIVQTHLSETRDECRLVRKLHGMTRYTDVYRRAGLLDSRTILGHGIWLKDLERKVIAESGAVIAHCPTANLFLQAGAMRLSENERFAMRTSLGSDIAGGPDVAMPRVARAMIETAKVRRLNTSPAFGNRMRIPTAAQAWWQITAGNAAALELAGGGRLAVGAPADIVVIDPSRGASADAAWPRASDPLGALLYGWDPRWITHTLAAGRVVYAG